MHVVRLMLGALLAVAIAVPGGIVTFYILADLMAYGRIVGSVDPEGLAYISAFAIMAVPALLLALAAIRSILGQFALRPWQRVAVGVAGGAILCWAIFSLYELVLLPHGLGDIWPLLLTMGGTGGLVTVILTRLGSNSVGDPTEG